MPREILRRSHTLPLNVERYLPSRGTNTESTKNAKTRKLNRSSTTMLLPQSQRKRDTQPPPHTHEQALVLPTVQCPQLASSNKWKITPKLWNDCFSPAFSYDSFIHNTHNISAVVIRNGYMFNYAGVPVEDFLDRDQYYLQNLRQGIRHKGTHANGNSVMTKKDLRELKEKHKAFVYLLTFLLDGHRTCKIGISSNPLSRLKSYLITYGHWCVPYKSTTLRNRTIHNHPNQDQVPLECKHADKETDSATGAFLHMALLCPLKSAETIEKNMKTILSCACTKPKRGDERFGVPIKYIIRSIFTTPASK